MCLQAFNSFMLLGGASFCQSTIFCIAFRTLPAPEMVHVAAGERKKKEYNGRTDKAGHIFLLLAALLAQIGES